MTGTLFLFVCPHLLLAILSNMSAVSFFASTPSDEQYVKDWIASTVQSLKDVPMEMLQVVFGPDVEAYKSYHSSTFGRTHSEMIYTDAPYHHPFPEFTPYTTKLAHMLPLEYLLMKIGTGESFRSWLDLRAMVQRSDFTPSVLAYLEDRINYTPDPKQSSYIMDCLSIPSRRTLAEIRRLVNM